MKFDGFLKLYFEDVDDAVENGDDEDGKRLPQMAAKDALDKRETKPEQHFTQPPPRYSEAALVKKMEELGIGRPSTYASIISVIQDREYVRKDKSKLHPEDKGVLVTAFLENFFRRYVEYGFTASLEEGLDDISGGRQDWRELLRKFWKDFNQTADDTLKLRNAEVIDRINEAMEDHIFPEKEDGSPPRLCPLCNLGQLSLKPGKFGAFIGCSNYPECKYTRALGGEDGPAEAGAPDGKLLGNDENGVAVTLRTGRFGPYVQLGEPLEKEKPPRASIPKGVNAEDVDLELALKLLSLPREVGPHPEDGEMITAGLGRYGPFIKHGSVYANVKDFEEVLSIGLNRAVVLLAEKKERGGKGGRGAAAKPMRSLGEHPKDQKASRRLRRQIRAVCETRPHQRDHPEGRRTRRHHPRRRRGALGGEEEKEVTGRRGVRDRRNRPADAARPSPDKLAGWSFAPRRRWRRKCCVRIFRYKSGR